MNDPARQASPLLTRLVSRPVASSLLRSTLAGLSPAGVQSTNYSSITSLSSTQSMGQSPTSSLPPADPIVSQNQLIMSTPPTENLVDDDTKLALFDSVLDELSPQAMSDSVPTNVLSSQSLTLPQSQGKTDDAVVSDPLVSMMSQSLPSDQFLPDTLNISPTATSSRRAPESIPSVVPTAEVPGIAYVEQEPNNLEIPVEVEGFLERVADHADKLPQEIVIQGNDIALNQVQPIKQAVIMLPISEEDEKLAKGKNPTWSIAWLVSWSQKIIKKFTGQVVYSHTPTQVANS